MARKLAAAHGLGDDVVVVARDELDELQSRLYCLQAALEDVERDLARSAAAGGRARGAFDWLVENARPAAEVWIEPRTTSRLVDITSIMGGPPANWTSHRAVSGAEMRVSSLGRVQAPMTSGLGSPAASARAR